MPKVPLPSRKRYAAIVDIRSSKKSIGISTTSARSAAKALFGAGGASENTPNFTLADEDFTDGAIDVLTLFVKSGLCASKSEARRTVEQGGATVDGEKVTDVKATFEKARFAEGLLLKRGKKNFRRAILK